jgi:two-component system sensor histidine kinase PilS (NtrC family)
MGRAGVGGGPITAFAVRLGALGSVFALAVLVQRRGAGEYSGREAEALYALVCAGVLQAVAQLLLGLCGWGGPRTRIFEVSGDGLLASALVYCAGGVESFFVFLYDVWIVHVAMRVGSRAAAAAAAAAVLSYGMISLGPVLGWLPAFEPDGAAPSWEHAAYSVALQSIGFVFVASLSYTLARQVQVGRHELLELGELHRRIVDNVASGLLTVDEARRITSFNREAERITGWTAAELLGQPIEQPFPVQEGVDVLLPRPLTEPRPVIRFQRRDGDVRHLGFSCSALRSSLGEADGAILVFQDLTRVVEMEEQLRRSERLSAVGQLAAGLAHEIRNPLASLSGALELLAADLAFEDDGSRRLLRIVQRETQRLNRLVSDFLGYARSGAGRTERVRLRPLFEELAQLLRGGEHRDLALALTVPESTWVWGDPDRVRQVFLNLLLNAAEASPPGASVEVRADEPEPGSSSVLVEVQDHGEGIAPEHLERVFEPFFTTKAKGSGLGLATVHRLVEAGGGSISLRSEPGRGTTLRVLLPSGEPLGSSDA